MTGATGPAGPQGAAGPAGVAGPAGMVYRGAYSSSTNYGLNDAVSYLGSSYISFISSNLGNAPNVNPSVWSLLAAQGAAGATGPAGATGAQGTTGVQGPQGVAGPAGPAGAVGVTFRGPWGLRLPTMPTMWSALVGRRTWRLPGRLVRSRISRRRCGGAGTGWKRGGHGAGWCGGYGERGNGDDRRGGNAGERDQCWECKCRGVEFYDSAGAAGANGTGGSGGGAGTSGIPFSSIYHSVSFNLLFHSVNSSADAATETDAVLTWVPAGCTATQLSVFSRETTNTVNVILRQGTPGSMANTSLACSVAPGASCTQEGNVTVAAGNFVDFTVTGASGTASGMWMALACN
ncbi:hypothetical protein RBB78_18980 [Tunturiibacter empetritectus]|uniref:hypothetical protein n=1 Tax=Tunturiibacter empetritectus TaxID=3069691 RepID=UPI003D9AF73B